MFHSFAGQSTASRQIARNAVSLILTTAATLAFAQGSPSPSTPASSNATDRLSGSLSFEVLNRPTYEGSANRATFALPILEVAYRSEGLGTFGLGRRGLYWDFLQYDKAASLGVFVGPDTGRKQTDTHGLAIFPPYGDNRLVGMGDLKSRAALGLIGRYNAAGVPIHMVVQHAYGDGGTKGTKGEMGANLPIAMSDSLKFRIGSALHFADGNYMQSMFGVTSTQSAASKFKAFDAKGGFYKVDLNMGVDYKLGQDWSLQAGVGVSRLRGSASSSPIVDKRTQTTVFTSASYHF